jgi:hypothetical protein
MTLEGALRSRSRRAGFVATISLTLSIVGLVAGIFYMPDMARHILESASQAYPDANEHADALRQSFVLAVLLICSGAGFSGCYLLAHHASRQFDLSARLIATADSICIADDDFSKFEKAVTLIMPPSAIGKNDVIPLKDLKALVDLVAHKGTPSE